MRAAAVAAVLLLMGCSREDADADRPKSRQWTAADREAAMAPVKRELAAGATEPWAGEYFEGDGLGVNVPFAVAPKAGFASSLTGCMGLYRVVRGSVTATGDELLLTFDETGAAKDDLEYQQRMPKRYRF